MPINHIISPEAKRDLKSIFKNTYRQWGNQQANLYLGKLYSCVETMAETPHVFKLLDPLLENIRVMQCEQHVIIAEHRGNNPLLIIGVFYKGMNIIDRVARRLQ